VLVSRLVAADPDSAKLLGELEALREELRGSAEKELGPAFKLDDDPGRRGYAPHVSLGYFADPKLESVKKAPVGEWTERFQAGLGGSTITYNSLDIYWFTDMASFFTG
jgi:hypothetical protein